MAEDSHATEPPELVVELYKSLRSEASIYIEKVPALWLQKFILVGALLAFLLSGRTYCGSVSGQLGDDRSERISGVGADDKVGEAALLPSSQDFLDGRRRVTGKYQQRVRRSQRGRVRVGGCHERGHGVTDHRHVEREFDVADSAEIGRHPHDVGPRVARHRRRT